MTIRILSVSSVVTVFRLLPHYHEDVRQAIDHVKQRAAASVELVSVGLLFRSGRTGCHPRELDVIGLKLRRVAEVDLQLIETLAKVSETRLNLRFCLLVVLQSGLRHLVLLRRLVNCRDAV